MVTINAFRQAGLQRLAFIPHCRDNVACIYPTAGSPRRQRLAPPFSSAIPSRRTGPVCTRQHPAEIKPARRSPVFRTMLLNHQCSEDNRWHDHISASAISTDGQSSPRQDDLATCSLRYAGYHTRIITLQRINRICKLLIHTPTVPPRLASSNLPCANQSR